MQNREKKVPAARGKVLSFEQTGDFFYKRALDKLDKNNLPDAAAYYGAELYSMEALPVLFSGRTNAFSITFGLSKANIGGLFCYLALEYPQTSAIGIYRRISSGA